MATPQPAPAAAASHRQLEPEEVFARAMTNVQPDPHKRYPSTRSFPYCDANKRQWIFARFTNIAAGFDPVDSPRVNTTQPSDNACLLLCYGEPTCLVAIYHPEDGFCSLYQGVAHFQAYDGHVSYIRSISCGESINTWGNPSAPYECCNKYLA